VTVPSIELTVANPSGLHARPATLFVETAAGFQSRITVENLDRGSRAVDAKSILFLLTIGVLRGHRIRLTADGSDADEALAALRELVESGLGEPTTG
jgi:phosphotransferase system HPr (HPr) family protein